MIKNIQTHPELANIDLGTVYVNYSYHAKEKAAIRGIMLSPTVIVSKGSVVELELANDGKTTIKIVVREDYDKEYDRVSVLIAKNGGIFVKTVWLNHKTDHHKTLNKQRIAA